PAFSPSTSACAKPSRISRRRFIGSASTATWSPPSRLITARIEEIFSASLAQAPKSASRPSMQCASSTVRSPSTGVWQTSTRSCSSWARSLHCRRLLRRCRLWLPDFHLASLRHQEQAEHEAYRRYSDRVDQGIADTAG